MGDQYHIPVMLQQCIEGLNIKPNGVYVDVTFGGGGHSKAILNALGDDGRLFSFDQDEAAKANLFEEKRFTFIPYNFKHLKKMLRLNQVTKIDGLLADLGVSSYQINNEERGFATRFAATLDMRMDQKDELTAFKVVNNYEEKQLADIFYYYGELNNSRKLASVLCEKRKQTTIETTAHLIEAIEPWIKGDRNRYLAQLFQAIRIEVNQELEVLKDMLTQSVELLTSGGRLVVLSYHSLEDRIVKNIVKAGNAKGTLDKDFYGNITKPLKAINKKVLMANESETRENKRARSAKLRIAEKI